MKKKKQIKIIISLLVMIAVLLGGWWMVRPNVLQAKKERTSGRTVYNVPRPQNENQINVGENFNFVKDAGQVVEDINNQVNPTESYLWTNVVQIVEQNELGEGVGGQSGALWYDEKISLKKSFQGEYEFYFGDKNKLVYDGMSFTLQNDPAGLDAIGGVADGFGVSGYRSDPPIKNALAVIFDAGYNRSFTIIPQTPGYSPTGMGRAIPMYNYSDFGEYLSNGKWSKLEIEWKSEEQIFKYTINGMMTQLIDFKTGETSGDYCGGYGEPVNPIPQVIPEIKAAADKVANGTATYSTAAEEYFQGESVWWGATGTSHGSLSSLSVAPLISIGQTPNQSQSPLQLSMKKLGEIGSDGERQPLAGAKFILQAQDADGRWQQFNPEKATKDVAEVFTTGTDGKIVIKATDNQKHADLIDLVLKYGDLENYQAFRFREVEAPTGYIQPPAIDPAKPNDYAASESEHSAGLFASKSVELSGASTTPSDPTPENPDDGDFGTVSNIYVEALMIQLTKTGAENKPLSGVEMTIGAKVTDKTTNQQKVMSLAQLSNSVKNTTLTEAQMKLTTDIDGKISVPENQLAMMMDLASSSLDVYKSLDKWVFIETKAADGYQPSPFLDGNWQEVPEAYKNKFIFNITDNWTSAEDIKSEYPVTAANALNQFTISPEAIGPEDEPLADASFTINDTPISNPYTLTVGTAASAPMYTLKQTNTNDGYASAQPVTFKLVQTPNKINEFTVTVEGNNTDNYFEFYYKVGEEKKSITPGTSFTSSDFLENPTLFLSLVNQPIGDFVLAQIETLDYGSISLPQKNPGELIKRENSDWKVQFTDTRLDAYRTPLKLSVRLDKDFTKTKAGEPTKTISGILLYRPNATTPITPDDFLIEGKEIPIKEKINPKSGPNDIAWPEQAGFLLQIDAEKQTKIFAGDYQAELTFILSEDPL